MEGVKIRFRRCEEVFSLSIAHNLEPAVGSLGLEANNQREREMEVKGYLPPKQAVKNNTNVNTVVSGSCTAHASAMCHQSLYSEKREPKESNFGLSANK